MNEHPFSFEELHGKSVEYQIHGKGTAWAFLRAKKFPDGRIEVSLTGQVEANVNVPRPETLDPKYLIRHPAPSRAEFLWATDVEYLRSWF